MSLLRHLKQSDDIVQVSKLGDYGPGAAFVKAVTSERDRIRCENEAHPVLSDEIVKDFRFKAGMIFAYGTALGLASEAREMIGKLEKRTQGG